MTKWLFVSLQKQHMSPVNYFYSAFGFFFDLESSITNMSKIDPFMFHCRKNSHAGLGE